MPEILLEPGGGGLGHVVSKQGTPPHLVEHAGFGGGIGFHGVASYAAGGVDYHTDMSQPSPAPGPLPAGVQPLVAVAVTACLLAIAAWLIGQARGDRGGLVDHDAPPVTPLQFTVDVNTADAAELAQLPGLGPTTAMRIIEHRQAHGPFASAESLLDVPGIGDTTLAGIRPHLRPIDTPSPAEKPEPSAASAP